MYSFVTLIFTGAVELHRNLLGNMQPHSWSDHIRVEGLRSDKSKQSVIFLVHREEDENSTLMGGLMELFKTCKWAFTSNQILSGSRDIFESFHKQRQCSSCVVFVVTANFRKDKILKKFLEGAYQHDDESPVIVITNETEVIVRTSFPCLSGHPVIEEKSKTWLARVYTSIHPYIDDNFTFNQGEMPALTSNDFEECGK